MSLKPICVKCQCFYRPKKNGTYFIEGMPTGQADDGPAPRGTVAPKRWKPYKLWVGDLWKCPLCSQEIIVGTPSGPISEHYKKDFKERCKELNAELQINDC